MYKWDKHLQEIDVTEILGDKKIIRHCEPVQWRNIWEFIIFEATRKLKAITPKNFVALIILDSQKPEASAEVERVDGEYYGETEVGVKLTLRAYYETGETQDCEVDFYANTSKGDVNVLETKKLNSDNRVYFDTDEFEWEMYAELTLMLTNLPKNQVYFTTIPTERLHVNPKAPHKVHGIEAVKLAKNKDIYELSMNVHSFKQEHWDASESVVFLGTNYQGEELFNFLKVQGVLGAIETVEKRIQALRQQDIQHYERVRERIFTETGKGGTIFDTLMKEFKDKQSKTRLYTVQLPDAKIPCAIFVRSNHTQVIQLMLVTPFVAVNVMVRKDNPKPERKVLYDMSQHSVQAIVEGFKSTNPIFAKLVSLNDLRTVIK